MDVINPTDVHVSIPMPKILDTVVDENSMEVFNESENAFNPLKMEDYKQALIRKGGDDARCCKARNPGSGYRTS